MKSHLKWKDWNDQINNGERKQELNETYIMSLKQYEIDKIGTSSLDIEYICNCFNIPLHAITVCV